MDWRCAGVGHSGARGREVARHAVAGGAGYESGCAAALAARPGGRWVLATAPRERA